jgi:hypothetical protein
MPAKTTALAWATATGGSVGEWRRKGDLFYVGNEHAGYFALTSNRVLTLGVYYGHPIEDANLVVAYAERSLDPVAYLLRLVPSIGLGLPAMVA